MKALMMILILACLSTARLTDLYLIFKGETRLQLQNTINNLQCKWEVVGNPMYIEGIWYQTIICKNVNEQKRGYLKSSYE